MGSVNEFSDTELAGDSCDHRLGALAHVVLLLPAPWGRS
jgi:hypothetical protein